MALSGETVWRQSAVLGIVHAIACCLPPPPERMSMGAAARPPGAAIEGASMIRVLPEALGSL
jgi:hypothetical protein